MVKATVNFDDELYRKLIKETVERYGKMRGFSKLVNEKIKAGEKMESRDAEFSKTENEEIRKRRNIVERTFGSWKINETGAEYVRKIRKGWEKRAKRLGI